MKRITIVGTKEVNFTDAQTGRVVEGRTYYYTEEDARTQGVMTGNNTYNSYAFEYYTNYTYEKVNCPALCAVSVLYSGIRLYCHALYLS